MEEARKVYEETLGLELAVQYLAESEKIHVARYYLGDVALELMEATDKDSEVAKFIDEYVSIEKAKEDYGVVIDPETLEID